MNQKYFVTITLGYHAIHSFSLQEHYNFVRYKMYPTKLCTKCRMELFRSCYSMYRGGHHMDSLKNMNAAMHYIENNLTNEINFKEVAKLAYCSEYHFKRMFSFLAGISLSEYIRCRRLTLAAFEQK